MPATPTATITYAPVQYYQVAAPLILVLLGIIFLQVRQYDMHVELAREHDRQSKALAVFFAGAALWILLFAVVGEIAALNALRLGDSQRREHLVEIALAVEVSAVVIALAAEYVNSLAHVSGRYGLHVFTACITFVVVVITAAWVWL